MVVAFYFRLHLAYFPRPVVAIFARPEQGNDAVKGNLASFSKHSLLYLPFFRCSLLAVGY